MSKVPTLRDTTVLCSRCHGLFSSREALDKISSDLSVPLCRFSELDPSNCSLCSIFVKTLHLSAHVGRQERTHSEIERLDGRVRLSFAYQLPMTDHFDDEASEISLDTSTPSGLDIFLCDELTGEVELTGELGWYALPDQVISTLGLDGSSTESVRHWHQLNGLDASAGFWKQIPFTRSILDMIDKCRLDHTACRAKDVPVLPSMVLDVSTSLRDGIIRLCVPRQGDSAEYVALSYCWGGPQKLVTTVANRTDHQQGVELSRLPHTIREAVQVTASLGIPYIWVDALCIVQDDYVAKAQEIEKMGKIYGNATLVLLAASGTGRAVEDGFLNPYGDVSIVPYFSAPIGKTVPVCLAAGTEASSPLDMRGWTYQERNLASRRLMFGGPRGVCFSCEESYLTFAEDTWTPDTVELREQTARRKSPTTLWHNLIEEYSLRALTFASDRLPAIAGFAAEYAPRPDDVYIAGLWKSQIIDDLLWKGQFGQYEGEKFKIPLGKYRSPGWSWTSVLDTVQNRTVGCITNTLRRREYLGGQEENVAEYVGHSLQLAQPDAQFGQVLGGKITLSAKVVPVKSTRYGSSAKAVLMECNYQLNAAEESQLEFLLAKYCTRWSLDVSGEVDYGYGSLIVLPSDDGYYRRVGLFWDWGTSEEEEMVDWDAVNYQEVTLV